MHQNMFVFTHLLFAAFIVCVAPLLAPPLRLLVPARGRGGGGLWLFGTTITEVQAIPLANLEGVFKAMECGSVVLVSGLNLFFGIKLM